MISWVGGLEGGGPQRFRWCDFTALRLDLRAKILFRVCLASGTTGGPSYKEEMGKNHLPRPRQDYPKKEKNTPPKSPRLLEFGCLVGCWDSIHLKKLGLKSSINYINSPGNKKNNNQQFPSGNLILDDDDSTSFLPASFFISVRRRCSVAWGQEHHGMPQVASQKKWK